MKIKILPHLMRLANLNQNKCVSKCAWLLILSLGVYDEDSVFIKEEAIRTLTWISQVCKFFHHSFIDLVKR
jgi:hypothetical protein